jgi:hypothetical protein
VGGARCRAAGRGARAAYCVELLEPLCPARLGSPSIDWRSCYSSEMEVVVKPVKPGWLVSALRLAALLAVLSVIPATPGQAQVPPRTGVIAQHGFGDTQNSYSWSMAWFKGKLYVGTWKNALCVEHATYDFYELPHGYSTQPTSGVSCPANRYDMDLRAEIWRFAPKSRNWRRVYRSPQVIPNPRAPGKFIARDIGFRGMAVYREPGGKRALYVGGVTAGEYIPELARTNPPRILRTTSGKRRSFKAIRGRPPTIKTAYGAQRPIGYRALKVYRGRLFVTASAGLLGDGVILEVKSRSKRRPNRKTFTQVSPRRLQVFELEVFGNHLYAGTGSAEMGYSVFRTNATGGRRFRFTRVVGGGAGRGPEMTSVVAMHVHRNRLYVGSNGWAGAFPGSELIRIHPDGTWDLVVGNARLLPGGEVKFPISGLPDGFGNFFNAHFWRAQTHGGALMVGTNDYSWVFRTTPLLDSLLRPEFGFDLFGSCDGRYWAAVTRNAFERGLYNFGARTMVSSRAGAFIGSANHVGGTFVWRKRSRLPCGSRGSARATTSASSAGAEPETPPRGAPPPPRRLLTDPQACGTVLSWDRSRGSARYRILRARSRLVRDIGVWKPPALPNGFVGDLPPTPASPGQPGSTREDIRITGSFAPLGTTSRGFFVDRDATPGARYTYQVIAESPSGGTSMPSNTAVVPSERPAATFGEVRRLVRETTARGKLPRGTADARSALLALESRARARWERTDRSAALGSLGRLRDAVGDELGDIRRIRDSGADEELQDAVLRLERRLSFAGAACRQ